MFGIDFSEILVIFGIALVVLGPEKLPKLAATIGRWIGRARGMARQFREQLEQEANNLHHGVDLGPEFGGRKPGSPTPSAGKAPRTVPVSGAVTPSNPGTAGEQRAQAAQAPQPEPAAASGAASVKTTASAPASSPVQPLEALHESVWPPDGPT